MIFRGPRKYSKWGHDVRDPILFIHVNQMTCKSLDDGTKECAAGYARKTNSDSLDVSDPNAFAATCCEA